MKRPRYESFRTVLDRGNLVRVAGAHSSLGAKIAEEAGFDAIWSSSLEVSAARGLPDASLLSMSEYLQAAQHMQHSVGIPVLADCDSGYGNNLNVAYMVHEYEAAGITAVCIEDKQYPKMNSFADKGNSMIPLDAFAAKIATAKGAQSDVDFVVVARTESFINGLGVEETLNRCNAYADAGADAILVHSKAKDHTEIMSFLHRWERDLPVVIVPTTYPLWSADEAAAEGVSVIIYANQGLRATVTALTDTYNHILQSGNSIQLEDRVASIAEVFRLQDLSDWTGVES
jgi:phosphoenolpyruvate phosphomutase